MFLKGIRKPDAITNKSYLEIGSGKLGNRGIYSPIFIFLYRLQKQKNPNLKQKSNKNLQKNISFVIHDF